MGEFSFPAWYYHKDGRAVLVKSSDEALAAGIDRTDLWADSPSGPWSAGPSQDQAPAAEPADDPEAQPVGRRRKRQTDDE